MARSWFPAGRPFLELDDVDLLLPLLSTLLFIFLLGILGDILGGLERLLPLLSMLPLSGWLLGSWFGVSLPVGKSGTRAGLGLFLCPRPAERVDDRDDVDSRLAKLFSEFISSDSLSKPLSDKQSRLLQRRKLV